MRVKEPKKGKENRKPYIVKPFAPSLFCSSPEPFIAHIRFIKIGR